MNYQKNFRAFRVFRGSSTQSALHQPQKGRISYVAQVVYGR